MTSNRMRQVEQGPPTAPPSINELIDRLSRFDGPPDQFLVNLLAVQCHVSGASGGAILRIQDGRPEVLAVWPVMEAGATAPVWLAQAAESAGAAADSGITQERPVRASEDLYGQPAGKHLVLIPIRGSASVRGAAAFVIQTADTAVLASCRERLELSISLLSLYEMRLTLQRRQFDLSRLRMAMEILSAVNEPDRFAGVAMALCNETASRWGCSRVSVGFLKGKYVQLKAMSHTEKFSRKMKIVQDIEAMMEECLDQDVEVVFPSAPTTTYVSRAAGELSRAHGPLAVVSLPLRRAGEPIAIISLERPADKPFPIEEIESIRLTCDLCTARLVNLHEHDRWIGAKIVHNTGKGLALLVGPKHTWAKLVVIAVFGAILFLTFARGEYQAEGSFVMEAVERRMVPAPFEGQIDSTVKVKRVGDQVHAGDLLAQMRTEDMSSSLQKVLADRESAVRQQQKALSEGMGLGEGAGGKVAEADMARAQIAGYDAQISLLNRHLDEAKIVAPIDGYVVAIEQDLDRKINPKVDTTKILFEIAPINKLRAELSVPEDQITDVLLAMSPGNDLSGDLATSNNPGQHIRFRIRPEDVNPVAETAQQKNVFKIRAELIDADTTTLRPGLEGVAKIDIDRRTYGELWTKRLVNWVRMKLWI